MVVVIASMAFVADVRSQLIPSLISLAIVLAAARWHTRRATSARRAAAGRQRVPVT